MEGDHLYCGPCQKQFTGWANLSEHNSSPSHRKTVEQKQRIDDMTQSLNILPTVKEKEDHESLDEYMKTEDGNIFLCELCNITCSGRIPALSHVRGKPHQQKRQKRQFTSDVASSGTPTIPGSTSSSLPASSPDFAVFQIHPVTGHYHCTVCKLNVSGKIPAEQHRLGKNHTKKLKIAKGRNEIDLTSSFSQLSLSTSVCGEASPKSTKPSPTEKDTQSNLFDITSNQPATLLEEEANTGDDETDQKDVLMQNNFDGDLEIVDTTGQWQCKICQVSLNSQKTIQQHFLGKAHLKKKKAAMVNLGDAEGLVPGVTVSQAEEVEFDETLCQWRCKICNVSLTSEIPLQEHLSGKSHQKRKASYCHGDTTQSSPSARMDCPYPSQQLTKYNPIAVRTSVTVESTKTRMLPNNSAVPRLPSRSDIDSCHEGQSHAVAWERSPCLDENLNQREITPDMGEAGESAVVGNMMRPDLHSLTDTYQEKKSQQMEGYGFDPAGSSSSSSIMSQYTQRQSNSTQDNDSPYWPLLHNNQNHISLSSNVRPPPGFGQDVLPRNRPMSDFLAHQFNASTNPPSHMHRFWSMPSGKQEDGNYDHSGLSNGLRTPKEVLPPIGTPAATVKVSEPTPKIPPTGNLGEDINEWFTVDGETGQKLHCKVCNITVTGRESADAHLAGSKHAKKWRVYQFQKNHMEPQIAIQEQSTFRNEGGSHSQYYGYHDNRFLSPSAGTGSSVPGTNSTGSFSASSDSYDYNFSSSSSSLSCHSGEPVPAGPLHTEPRTNVGDDRFHSLRGISLCSDQSSVISNFK